MAQCIMVIDNEPEHLRMVRDLLVSLGYDALSAEQPDLVLDTIQERHPALVLVDITLPGMTGIELAAALRERADAHTPIIGMSASRLMRQLAGLSGLFTAIVDEAVERAKLRSLIECHLGDTGARHAVR